MPFLGSHVANLIIKTEAYRCPQRYVMLHTNKLFSCCCTKHMEDMEGQEEVTKMLRLAGVDTLLSNGGKVRGNFFLSSFAKSVRALVVFQEKEKDHFACARSSLLSWKTCETEISAKAKLKYDDGYHLLNRYHVLFHFKTKLYSQPKEFCTCLTQPFSCLQNRLYPYPPSRGR